MDALLVDSYSSSDLIQGKLRITQHDQENIIKSLNTVYACAFYSPEKNANPATKFASIIADDKFHHDDIISILKYANGHAKDQMEIQATKWLFSCLMFRTYADRVLAALDEANLPEEASDSD